MIRQSPWALWLNARGYLNAQKFIRFIKLILIFYNAIVVVMFSYKNWEESEKEGKKKQEKQILMEILKLSNIRIKSISDGLNAFQRERKRKEVFKKNWRKDYKMSIYHIFITRTMLNVIGELEKIQCYTTAEWEFCIKQVTILRIIINFSNSDLSSYI